MAPPLSPKELLLKIAPRLPLFQGLGIGVLEDLMRCGSMLLIKQGEKLASEGEKPDSFFVILSGEAKVEKHVKSETVQISMLTSGDCVGEMTIIASSRPRPTTVTATKDSLVLKVHQFKLKMFPGLVSELYLNIARILEERLRLANMELAKTKMELMKLEGKEPANVQTIVASVDPSVETHETHEGEATWLTNDETDLKRDVPDKPQ
jgi:CRP-like cAMP-binding protein